MKKCNFSCQPHLLMYKIILNVLKIEKKKVKQVCWVCRADFDWLMNEGSLWHWPFIDDFQDKSCKETSLLTSN